ncbi:MAG: MFS transporter [Actinomycetota bacterium]|nr:MFS transporter [Actinomycetota bacterium]
MESGVEVHAANLPRPDISPLDPTYRALSLGIFAIVVVIAFEFMAVATALPVAARELGGLSFYAWALTGFLGAAMFATGVAGGVCDRIGPRLPLAGGGLGFGVGLLISGFSTSMTMLVCGRIVQGLGAGLTIVSVYVVIGQCYPEALRPKMMSLIATAWVVPSVVGPFIAGGLTQYVSWRWAFLSIAPLVPIPLALVVPRIRGERRTRDAEPGRVRLALAMAVGAGVLQWAGLEAEGRHWAWAAAAVVVSLALVIFGALRLFPPGTLRLRRGLPSVVAFRGVIAGGFFGCQAFVPLMLVEHRGATPTLAGLAVAGTALGWASGSWWQGRSGLRTRRSGLVRIGAAVTAVGVVVTGSASVVTSALVVPAWLAGVGLVVGGLGMGLSMSSNSVLLLDLSPPDEQGANSAALQMSDSLGGLIVIGAGGVIYALWRHSWPATQVFGLIFALCFSVMLVAVWVAFRVRPRGPTL